MSHQGSTWPGMVIEVSYTSNCQSTQGAQMGEFGSRTALWGEVVFNGRDDANESLWIRPSWRLQGFFTLRIATNRETLRCLSGADERTSNSREGFDREELKSQQVEISRHA